VSALLFLLLAAPQPSLRIELSDVQDASPAEIAEVMTSVSALVDEASLPPSSSEASVRLHLLGGLSRIRIHAELLRAGQVLVLAEVQVRRDSLDRAALLPLVQSLLAPLRAVSAEPGLRSSSAQASSGRALSLVGWISLGLGAVALGSALALEAVALGQDGRRRDEVLSDDHAAALAASSSALHLSFRILAGVAAGSFVLGSTTLGASLMEP
jgi:hypothetical protein